MSLKSKGINAERQLVHMFWSFGWSCIRVAGSGSSKYPSPDIIAGNNLRKVAIECKVTKNTSKFFDDKEINELLEFSKIFGSEPWIAVKFNSKGWFFINPEDLKKTGKGYSIDFKAAEMKGLSFEDMIK